MHPVDTDMRNSVGFTVECKVDYNSSADFAGEH